MTSVAGHSFPNFGPCHCGLHWPTIRNVTPADVHKPGIAHTGNLSQFEYEQIAAERAAEDARIEAAMGEAMR